MSRSNRKLPQWVRLLGRDIPVSLIPSSVSPENHGIYSRRFKSILIMDEQDPLEEADTLIHEVFHCIADLMGIRFPDDDTEEAAVSAFATGMVGLMRDSPEFVKWLQTIPKIDKVHPTKP